MYKWIVIFSSGEVSVYESVDMDRLVFDADLSHAIAVIRVDA